MTGLTFEVVRGTSARRWLGAMARLRITVFREWPYLYEGDQQYEREYLASYFESPHSAVIVARDGDRVAGVSTALPLADADPAFQAPFERAGLPVADYYYLGESVLTPAWRGRGAGHRFFDLREAAALAWGAAKTCFCAVDRDEDDPRRPLNARDLTDFWTRRGYQRHYDLRTRFPWQEVGGTKEIEHTMTFWVRELDD